MTDTDSTSAERVERRTRFVAAPPQAIFDLLADPAAHVSFDGSGTVQSSRDDEPERLELGARFGMNMKVGVPYRMTNEVIEFDEPHLIAWRHYGRHVWRYRLAEVDGGTEVTEEFDWGASIAPWFLKLAGYPQRNARSLDATLDRLAAIFADGPDRTDETDETDETDVVDDSDQG